MNATETGMVLEMIAAHYWQTPRVGDRNAELMVRTWQKALADIPLQPHIELALDEWFRSETWPPQAAELRERALELGGPTPTQIAEAEAWRARLSPTKLEDRQRDLEAAKAYEAKQLEREQQSIEQAARDPTRPPTISAERWAGLLPEVRKSFAMQP